MNKYQEAFKKIKNVVVFNKNYIEYQNSLEYIKELVDKATPKEPIFPGENYFFLWKCPSCNQDFISDSANNYCSNCGQTLDWSEDE